MIQCAVHNCIEWQTERHHIVTKGARGADEDYNIMHLCRYHHDEFHRHGWLTFSKAHKDLEEQILTAREKQGKRT